MTASSVETADRRHQVFLSSTYFDLIPVRQAVVQHILKVDRYIPAGMELFSASPQPPWDVITSALAGTDYMVLILGTRYGTIMQPEGISYTEKEYNYANDNGIPVLAFLGAENRMVPADSAESATHRRLLKKFRDRVAGSSTIEHWSTDAELPAKVITALAKAVQTTPRPGWIRGNLQNAAASVLPDPQPAPAPLERVAALLNQPGQQGRVELEETVLGMAAELRAAIDDTNRFSTTFPAGITDETSRYRYLVTQGLDLCELALPLAAVMAVGCAFGSPQDEALWTQTLAITTSEVDFISGTKMLVSMRRIPSFVIVFSGAMASLRRKNYGALRAITVEPLVSRENVTVPLVSVMHPWRIVEHGNFGATAIALVAQGQKLDDVVANTQQPKRHTPVLDLVHSKLRLIFAKQIPLDSAYTELFTRTEIFLALIAADMKLELKKQSAEEFAKGGSSGIYVDDEWAGSFTWRDPYNQNLPETLLLNEFRAAGANWPPLLAGLFGGSQQRALSAFEKAFETFKRARHSFL